tara:strand:+ start:838 stop:1443 length:606 start_codon:yes stop_codon:yes gene_type:complete
MTAKIKLNAASGGGSFSLQAPSSSANTRVMTLPDTADGTILTTTNPKAGNILQVVQTAKTDSTTYSSVAHTAFTADVMTATITPSSSSNKVLISCVICMQLGTTDAGFKFNRGGTDICVGDTSGVRRPVTIAATQSSSNEMFNLFAEFLDSPNTTSATTYGVKVTHGSSGSVDIFINQMNAGNDDKIMRPTSSLTLKEVAA